MFTIDNQKIGLYISNLIETKFHSARQFCKAYLKIESGTEAAEDSIKNMANRLSQIKNGNKAIQLHDLPIFSMLLDVSMEQILSAGQYGTAQNSRITNYTVAQSHCEKEWISFIEKEGKPVLNADEYGKTVLDYAIEFSNYNFLKFLIDKNYIWFDSQNIKDYSMTFSAGTSIQKTKPAELENSFYRQKTMNDLQRQLTTKDEVRINIITLAAANNDIEMLEKLRAREIPELYWKADYLSCNVPDFNAYYNQTMVNRIAKAGNSVLNYFTEPFEIHYFYKSDKTHTFMFPYISKLLDMLIINNRPFLKKALEKCIAHNEEVLKRLTALIKTSIVNDRDCGDSWKNEVDFHENGNIISFRDTFTVDGIITNIVNVTKKTKDAPTNQLIEKLNRLYDKIRNIKIEGLV